MQNKRGLGRGLNSLLGVYDLENNEKVLPKEDKIEKVLQHEVAKSGVEEIDISLIDVNVDQPRKNFDPSALQELADSIKLHGIFQPIILNKSGDRYMIVAGERRFKAAGIAGLKKVPAVVKNYTAQQIKEIALLENIQREDLNPIEAARAMKQLQDTYNWTQDELATRLGKSRPAVANLLRLLALQPEVILLIESGKLSPGHARSLVVVTDPKAQVKLAHLAITKKITVRDLENAVKQLQGPKRKLQTKQPSVEFNNLIDELRRKLGTKISYSGGENRGKIVIEYYSKDDLDRIFDLVKK